MKILISNGRLIDPANQRDEASDILIEKGKITAIAKPGQLPKQDIENARTLDATGQIVAPGFIDMHVHFREPGFEYKETIETGCRSAAAGGFTTVAMMPNTNPVNDNRSVTEFMISQARTYGAVNALPIGAISVGLKGEMLTDMGDLKSAGVVAYSDDGRR